MHLHSAFCILLLRSEKLRIDLEYGVCTVLELQYTEPPAGVRARRGCMPVHCNQLQLHALVDMIPFNHIVVVFSPPID